MTTGKSLTKKHDSVPHINDTRSIGNCLTLVMLVLHVLYVWIMFDENSRMSALDCRKSCNVNVICSFVAILLSSLLYLKQCLVHLYM